MKPETLLESLNYIEDDLLAGAERPLQAYRKKPHLGLIAAAAVLVIGVSAFAVKLLPRLLSGHGPAQQETEDMQGLVPAPTEGVPELQPALPMLTGTPEGFFDMDLAGDALQLRLQQTLWPTYPIRQDHPEGAPTLPVFQMVDPEALSREQLRALAAELAGRLGMAEAEIQVEDEPESWDMIAAIVRDGNGMTLTVNQLGRATVEYEEGRGLQPPENYDGDARALKYHYLQQLSELLALPYRDAASAASNGLGTSGRDSTEAEELFLSDELLDVELNYRENGELQLVSFGASFTDWAISLGDYPTLSFDAAWGLAQQGQFYTYAGSKAPLIAQLQAQVPEYAELRYFGTTENELLPFYCFWLVNEAQSGYTPVLVPAVDWSYLVDPPEAVSEVEDEPAAQARALPVLEAGDSFHEALLTESRAEAEQLREYLWSQESEFERLPVFEARERFYDSTAPILDEQSMTELLRSIAETVGFDAPEILPAVYNLPMNGTLPADAWDYVAQSGDQSIWIRDDGRVQINFGQAQRAAFLALPDETRVQLSDDRAFAEEYYVNQYYALLQIPYREAAELYLESTTASIDSRYRAGRSSDTAKELYLADVLRNVVLELDADGCLRSLAFDACFRERWLPLGDYPIIPYEAARALVGRGQYFTDGLGWSEQPEWAGYAFDWNDDAYTHGELIYLRDAPAALRLPYYRFFATVHIHNDQTGDERYVYVPVYVPAVRADYLSDMPEPISTEALTAPQPYEIPLLPDAGEFVALLPQKDTVRLEIGMYHDAFTVENADGLGFSVEKGQIKENAVKAEEGASSVEEIVSTTYRVPFAETYRLSYDEPQENCNFKVSWSDGAVFARGKGIGIQTVECSLSGIRLTGENMRFTLKYFAENGKQELLKITGAEESAVCLIRTADGFRFYCENGAHMELPDFYEISAVRELEIPAGTVGVLEGISKGYDAELSTEPFPD